MNREAPEGTELQLEIDLREDEPVVILDLSDEPEAESETHGLTDLELRILDFERRWYRRRGLKHVALSRQFGISPIRYFQILNQTIDKPEAVILEPTLVNRLRRVRDSRRRMHGTVRSVLSA